jgi:hypothetical protein
MEFLHPTFLWGLFLIAIPIIVHLFYFRRYKKVYFSNVRFLRSVKEEQSTWRKLRNLLVLLARILALAFLVFAFAQPFIPTADQKMGSKAVSVYIDNSFSMNARGEAVSLVDQAKKRAFEIVDAQDVETQFQIVSNAFNISSSRWVNQEEAYTLIEDIEVRPEVKPLNTVFRYQDEAFDRLEVDQEVRFLLSDFQKTSTKLPEDLDTSILTYLLPLKAVQTGNISIDSVWFDAPILVQEQPSRLFVKITNYGDQDAENVRLSIQESKETRPFGQLKVAGGETLIDTVNITPKRTGWQEAIIQVSDYPVQFDDRYYISYEVPEKVNILSLHENREDRYLQAAMDGIRVIKHESQASSNINYAGFSTYDLILVQDLKTLTSGIQNALQRYIQGGGNVLLFPPFDFDQEAYNNFLQRLGAATIGKMNEESAEVFQLEQEAFLFNDVYETQQERIQLPKVSAYSSPQARGRLGEEKLLRFRDGDPYLSQYAVGNGYLFLSYAPISNEFNSLTTEGEVFVPLLFRAALISDQNLKLAYTIGKQSSFSIKKEFGVGEADYRIEGAVDFIPLQRNMGSQMLIDLQQQITQAGFYKLLAKDSLVRKLAFNYDRAESDLSPYNREELRTLLPENWQIMKLVEGESITRKVNQAVSGIELWKWCIILTLVFLAIEQLILRFWKIE